MNLIFLILRKSQGVGSGNLGGNAWDRHDQSIQRLGYYSFSDSCTPVWRSIVLLEYPLKVCESSSSITMSSRCVLHENKTKNVQYHRMKCHFKH